VRRRAGVVEEPSAEREMARDRLEHALPERTGHRAGDTRGPRALGGARQDLLAEGARWSRRAADPRPRPVPLRRQALIGLDLLAHPRAGIEGTV